MKSVFKILAVVFLLAFVSCNDEDELVKNEQNAELQSINKEDVTAPGNDGGTDPDNGEE